MNHLDLALFKETFILVLISVSFTLFFMWYQTGFYFNDLTRLNFYMLPLAYLIGFNVGLKYTMLLFKSYVDNRQIHWLMTVLVGIPFGFILSHLIMLLSGIKAY